MTRTTLLACTLLALAATAPDAAPAQTGMPESRTGSPLDGQRVRVTLDRYGVGQVRGRSTFTGKVISAGGDSLVVFSEQGGVPLVLRRHDVRRLFLDTGLRSRKGPMTRNAVVGALVGTFTFPILTWDDSGALPGAFLGATVGMVIAGMLPAPEVWLPLDLPRASPGVQVRGDGGVAISFSVKP